MIENRNQHILNSLNRAYSAVLALSDAGHDILSVDLGRARPVIEIRPCRATRLLKGGLRMIETGPQGRRETFAAPFQGVQVEWRVTP